MGHLIHILQLLLVMVNLLSHILTSILTSVVRASIDGISVPFWFIWRFVKSLASSWNSWTRTTVPITSFVFEHYATWSLWLCFKAPATTAMGHAKHEQIMLVICSVRMYAYDIRKHMTWYLKAEHLAELPILSRLRRNWSFLVLYPVSSTWSFAQCPPQSQLLSCLRRWRGAADDLVWADRGAPARWRSSTPRARRTRTPYRWTSRRRSPWCTTPCNKCVKTTPQTHTCHSSIPAAEHAGRWGIGSIFRNNRPTSAMDKNLDLGADKLGSCT